MQQHYKGFCITQQQNGQYKIEGYTNIFFSSQTAKAFIDVIAGGITKVNENCKPTICPKCQGKGYYFVNEFIGNMQGRRDCNCKYKN